MKSLLLLIALMFTCLVGCEESGMPLGGENGDKYPPTAYGTYNDQNPHDSAGIRHNDNCESIYNSYESDDSTVAACKDAIRDELVNLYQGQGLSNGEMSNHLDTAYALVDQLMQGDIAEYFTDYSDTTVYSLSELTYFYRIGMMRDNATSTLAVLDSLTVIESDMLEEGWSSSSPMLSTFSVLKHSFYYWNDIYPLSYMVSNSGGLSKISTGCYQCMYDLIDALGAASGHHVAKKRGLTMLENEYWALVDIHSAGASNYYMVLVTISETLPPWR